MIDMDADGAPYSRLLLFREELATIDRDFLVRGPLGPRVPDDVLGQVVRAVIIAIGGRV